MSIFSDHNCGAMSDSEFKETCNRMNREDRADRDIIPCECRDCKWYLLDDERDENYCGNEESEHFGEYTSYRDGCSEWGDC